MGKKKQDDMVRLFIDWDTLDPTMHRIRRGETLFEDLENKKTNRVNA